MSDLYRGKCFPSVSFKCLRRKSILCFCGDIYFVLLYIFELIFISEVLYSDMSCAPQVCSVCCLNASEIGEESSANGKESLTDVDTQCVPCHTHENDNNDPGNIIKMFPFKFAFCQHRGGMDLLIFLTCICIYLSIFICLLYCILVWYLW